MWLTLGMILFGDALLTANVRAAGADPAAAKPDIRVLHEPADMPRWLTEQLEKAKFKAPVFSSSTDPRINAIADGLGVVVRDLWLPKDGGAPIAIYLYDDVNPNAFYIRGKQPTERAIGVSVGLVNLMDTDEQLAFILGHELEHGVADIHAYVESEKKR